MLGETGIFVDTGTQAVNGGTPKVSIFGCVIAAVIVGEVVEVVTHCNGYSRRGCGSGYLATPSSTNTLLTPISSTLTWMNNGLRWPFIEPLGFSNMAFCWSPQP